jgi:polyphenol oxidase
VDFISPDWPAIPGVLALCTTRQGGCSNEPWNSLNLGTHVGDDPQAVAENRRRLRDYAALPAEPHWLQQVHGTAVADVATADANVVASVANVVTADAAVTTQAGEVCAILTADCLPILLAASDGTAVGAAHAGWRGLAAGVVERAVEALRARASHHALIVAWMGPGISAAHFEVGPDVYAAFTAQKSDAAAAFTLNARGRWQCDLFALARARLTAAGVQGIYGGNYCTYADADRFFSHRRDVQHQRQAATGRMAALIWRAA